MNFKYAFKTFYYIMDNTHQYVVADASTSYYKNSVTVTLKKIADSQGLSPGYSPRWREKLTVEPVHTTLTTIRQAIENNTCLYQLDSKSIELPDAKFEIVTVSEEIDCIVESEKAIEISLQEEKDVQLALKRKQFEEFTTKLDFNKLSLFEIGKLTEIVAGK